MNGALFDLQVMHRRYDRHAYCFNYRIFSLWMNIDRMQATCAPLRWLSLNRFNLLSINWRDHGPRDGSPLRPWVDQQLAESGVPSCDEVYLLAMPRMLGFVFNPLSIYYCYRNGQLAAVILEVKNTFGEQHPYILTSDARGLVHGFRDKQFHVSPFLPMDLHYEFKLKAPADQLSCVIHDYHADRRVLTATQQGRRIQLSDRNLAFHCLRMPLLTLKVFALIHWHALKLWWRGAKIYTHPDKISPAKKETAS